VSRETLRTAIDNLAAAQSAVKFAEDRRREVNRARLDAMRRHDTARAALDDAQASNQRERLDRLLAGDDAHHAKTVEAMRRDIDDAAAALRALEHDVALLDAEIDRRRDIVVLRTSERTAAVADTLRPTARALLDLVDRLRQRAVDVEHALGLMPAAALPSDWSIPRHREAAPELAALVADAVAALALDPDAPIPSLETFTHAS
jgi:hypothetical protein